MTQALRKRARSLDKMVDKAAEESGQATVEYAYVAFALMGGAVASWPFTVELINAMNSYYEAIYWVINSPIP